MKYNMRAFQNAVEYYRKNLPKSKVKNMLVVVDYLNKNAYLSIAPLSAACHTLGIDIFTVVKDRSNASLEVLFNCYSAYQNRLPELMDFIKLVKKKTDISGLFTPPGIILHSKKKGFSSAGPKAQLSYKTSWHKLEKYALLKKTCNVIWDQVMNLKKKEYVGVAFELVPNLSELELPLRDYLDSYFISMAMAETAYKITGRVAMSASTNRKNMMEKAEKISDLLTIIKGCEFSKNINEPVFRQFRKLSPVVEAHRLIQPSAVFGLKAKGYPGRHLFGETIGYPTPNRKSRWQSPGHMFLKLDFLPQTKHDSRKPVSRISFTETLPVDLFIKTNNIDWMTLQKRNNKIARIMNSSDHIEVKGRKVIGGTTDFKVNLIMKNGKHRWVRLSDVDTRTLVNNAYKKRTGIEAGNMANIPGGEAFVTPEKVKGTIIGDVVISIDRSYRLKAKEPIVIEANGKYKIKSGPKKILDTLNKQKKDAWKRLLTMEKAGAMPKALIKMKKDNFNNIGEFAVNTNPTAELCDYLIVNEKIANMIHVALGSGFEPDRATEYHYDIVIDAPRQKLDIYGIDKTGKKRWILKKGIFAL